MNISPLAGATASRRSPHRRRSTKPPTTSGARFWTKRRDALRRKLVSALNAGADPTTLFDTFNAYLNARELAKGEQ